MVRQSIKPVSKKQVKNGGKPAPKKVAKAISKKSVNKKQQKPKAQKAKAPAKAVKAKPEKKQAKKAVEKAQEKWTSLTQNLRFIRVRDPQTGRLIGPKS